MSRILAAYFSASGGKVTERVAGTLAEAVGADLYEIKPKMPYSQADLNWNDRNSRSTVEMKDPASRPEILAPLPNIAEYDTIFIGFPIWWYVAPRIIETFLESADFSGKRLAAFATSGGSGMGETDKALAAVCPKADWRTGKLFRGSASKEELAAWAGSVMR